MLVAFADHLTLNTWWLSAWPYKALITHFPLLWLVFVLCVKGFACACGSVNFCFAVLIITIIIVSTLAAFYSPSKLGQCQFSWNNQTRNGCDIHPGVDVCATWGSKTDGLITDTSLNFLWKDIFISRLVAPLPCALWKPALIKGLPSWGYFLRCLLHSLGQH